MKKLLLLVGLVVFLTPMVVSAEEIEFKCECMEKLAFKSIDNQNPEKDLKIIDCLYSNIRNFLDNTIYVQVNLEKEEIILDNILFLNADTEYYQTRFENRENEIFAYIDQINDEYYRMLLFNRYDLVLVHKLISPRSEPYEIIQEKYQCEMVNKIF